MRVYLAVSLAAQLLVGANRAKRAAFEGRRLHAGDLYAGDAGLGQRRGERNGRHGHRQGDQRLPHGCSSSAPDGRPRPRADS